MTEQQSKEQPEGQKPRIKEEPQETPCPQPSMEESTYTRVQETDECKGLPTWQRPQTKYENL